MNKLKLPMAAALLATASVASAGINFRGYGSIVGGKAISVDEGQTVLDYTDEINFKQDSLIALQMDADLEDNLTATMQLMSRGESDYSVNVDWAYLTYTFTDDFQVSVGRIRAPYYRYSDYLDVRYAYNWVKAPSQVYSFQFPGFDGISMLYNKSIGPVDSTLQVYTGSTDGPISPGDSVRIHIANTVGAAWLGSWEWLTARASYIQSKVTIETQTIDDLADRYNSLGTGMLGVSRGFAGAAVAGQGTAVGSRAAAYSDAFAITGAAITAGSEDVRIEDDQSVYMAFGLAVDKGPFIAEAEVVHYEMDEGFSPETDAYYLTLGWRMGNTLMYGTYGRAEGEPHRDYLSAVPDLSAVASAIAADTQLAGLLGAVEQLPDDLNSSAVSLVAGYEGLRRGLLAAGKTDTVTTQVGARWDFHPSAALKVSYERHDDRINNIQGGLFRTAIDFVF